VVVIALPLPSRSSGAFIDSRQRDAFGAGTISTIKVHWGISGRDRTLANGIHLLESVVPIAMGIRVFAPEPANQITVVKIEAE
jgi:hypothetical protein